jgi:hypothetical protein
MSVASLRMAAGLAACLLAFPGGEAFVGKAFAQEFQTALRVSSQGGGKCIEVLGREILQGQQLQMMDCDSSFAQIFTYDPANAHLSIGGLCVDADVGRAGELVRLRSCSGGADQVWKAEPKGNFTKLAGVNGLCLDIRFGSKENGAPLQGWTCGDAEPNQLWSFQRE